MEGRSDSDEEICIISDSDSSTNSDEGGGHVVDKKKEKGVIEQKKLPTSLRSSIRNHKHVLKDKSAKNMERKSDSNDEICINSDTEDSTNSEEGYVVGQTMEKGVVKHDKLPASLKSSIHTHNHVPKSAKNIESDSNNEIGINSDTEGCIAYKKIKKGVVKHEELPPSLPSNHVPKDKSVENIERKCDSVEEVCIDSDTDGSSNSEEGFIVEEIIDKKIENGIVKYYLKWKGWAPVYNSWEPESNLDCFQLIQEFEEKWENKTDGDSNACSTSAASNVNNLNVTTSEMPSTSDESLGLEALNLGTSTNPSCNSAKGVSQNETEEEDEDGKSGFALGWEPKRIVGASDLLGKVMVLMEWENEDLELLSAAEAKRHCPQLLIDFYETHLSWHED